MPSSGSDGSRSRPPEGRDAHGERHPSGWRVRPPRPLRPARRRRTRRSRGVIGPVTVITENGGIPLPGASDISPVTQQLVDEEVRHLIEEPHEQVTQLMSANRDKLDALASALLENETVEQDEAYAAASIEPRHEPAPPITSNETGRQAARPD